MFCDLAERNAQAKEVANGLSDDDSAGVTTADMSFRYPITVALRVRRFSMRALTPVGSKAVRVALLVPGV